MTVRHIGLYVAFWVAAFVAVPRIAMAGPPFLTDDPDPVPYHHWEFYTFANGDQAGGTSFVNGPAIELNYGAAPNTQLHLILSETYFSGGGYHATTIGDTEMGIKYRFATETKTRPEVGAFPLLELPTGSQAAGTGNGTAWTKIPIWLEKNWGPWQSYGGGGFAFNSAPGQKNFAFGGVLVQKTVSPNLALGGEVFIQGDLVDPGATVPNGPQTLTLPGTRYSDIWNAGGQYNFTPDFSLLFSGGHSFSGDGNSVFYLAFYRTWGPGAP